MITVTRLNGTRVTVSSLLIETVEETPDTIITLTTGKKIIVKEKMSEVIALTATYFQRIGLTRAAVELQQSEGS